MPAVQAIPIEVPPANNSKPISNSPPVEQLKPSSFLNQTQPAAQPPSRENGTADTLAGQFQDLKEKQEELKGIKSETMIERQKVEIAKLKAEKALLKKGMKERALPEPEKESDEARHEGQNTGENDTAEEEAHDKAGEEDGRGYKAVEAKS